MTDQTDVLGRQPRFAPLIRLRNSGRGHAIATIAFVISLLSACVLAAALVGGSACGEGRWDGWLQAPTYLGFGSGLVGACCSIGVIMRSDPGRRLGRAITGAPILVAQLLVLLAVQELAAISDWC